MVVRPERGWASVFVPLGLLVTLAGCVTGPMAGGMGVVELDPSTRGPVAGVGIEGQDVVAMSDRMMRDILSNPILANAARPPQVTIDSEAFRNESSQRINVNVITSRLRNELNRAARGRMVFVSRENAAMVEQERNLRRSGRVDVGTIGLTRAQAGADFRLAGRITSIDQVQPRTGSIQRYTQISFEMIDMERGTIVWSGIYEFARAGADDIIYR
jgi:PBP1b-binding outer membrane lipoprotein LpoB